MRTITVAEFISLDGVVEAPEQWHMSYVDAEMMALMFPPDREPGTLLLGRTTFDGFAAAFSNAPADDPVAGRLTQQAKLVVTSSPETVTWANTTPLVGDPVTVVGELKQRPGDAITLTGSTRLARTLLAAGLVDELHLLLHPVVVGTGGRLFPDDGPGIGLRLTGSTALSSGVISLRYAPA